MTRALLLASSLLALAGCERFDVPPPRVAFPWQGIADVAGPSPVTPLTAPTTPMFVQRGRAPLAYPSAFGAAIRPDGTITLPRNGAAHVRGANLVGEASVLLTVSENGVVSGSALKRKYAFNDAGELVDENGHGVRMQPDGRVRALGGSVRHADVMVWLPETRGERWDYAGWRTMSIVSLLLLEHLLPETVGLTTTTSAVSTSPNSRTPSSKRR